MENVNIISMNKVLELRGLAGLSVRLSLSVRYCGTVFPEEAGHQPQFLPLRGHFPILPSLAFDDQNSSYNLAPNISCWFHLLLTSCWRNHSSGKWQSPVGKAIWSGPICSWNKDSPNLSCQTSFPEAVVASCTIHDFYTDLGLQCLGEI